MVNAVLDTNVLVSGLLSASGNPAVIINALRAGRFTLLYTDDIIAEYRDVLYRDKLGLNTKDVDDLLEEISKIGFAVLPDKSNVALPDEDDRAFYDTAKSQGAYLVTGNLKHFPGDPLIVSASVFAQLII